MKRKLRILITVVFFAVAPVLMSQTPPHPNNGSNPGVGNGPVGGGAPIGSDLAFLIAFASAYGVQKLHKLKNNTPVA